MPVKSARRTSIERLAYVSTLIKIINITTYD